MKPTKTLSYLFVLAVGLFTLNACNTIRGAGEDVEAAGETVQEAAEDTEEKLKE